MASRYTKRTFIQPTRKISLASSDIPHKFNQFDNIDSLAEEYFGDVTLGWVIMCANPNYGLEFEIKPGDIVRIPFPLERVWTEWGFREEV